MARQLVTERARREQEAATERQRHLDSLAVDEPAWQRIATMIDTKKPREYDTAVQLLVDLRDLSEQDGHTPRFVQHVQELRARHATKPSLLARLNIAGLGN